CTSLRSGYRLTRQQTEAHPFVLDSANASLRVRVKPGMTFTREHARNQHELGSSMSNPFFDHPVINSPYKYPGCHWELDETGQPTQKKIPSRRAAEFISPIPKPRKRKGQAAHTTMFVNDLSRMKLVRLQPG
ncbi:MAG: hypothetical protein WA151_18735, partial [Desulfatirhabdiaceae bacterium]